MKYMGGKLIWLILVGLLGWNFIMGARLAAETGAGPDSPEVAYEKMKLLAKVLVKIREVYVDEDKIDFQHLLYGALRGMLNSLDPHSQFLDEDMYKDMREETSGEFGGLGIVIGVRENLLTVISPIEDTPAFRAGVISGDRIIEIDGEPTDGMSLQEAVKQLKGPPKTKVTIKIMRTEPREIKKIDIIRDIISVPSVKDVRMLEDNVGYLRIVQFNEQTERALYDGVKSLLKQGMTALVVDVRSNPGGLLSVAIEVSQAFLPKGSLIVSTRGRGDVNQLYTSKGSRHFTDFPMVLLVNRGSASASEILAGALQDHKRAVIVGERSFGKGSVQTVLQLEDGSAIRLTTAKYYTPNGRMIHDKGIDPDISVYMSPESFQKIVLSRTSEELNGSSDSLLNVENVRDIQLDRAADVLKGVRVFQNKML